MTGATMRPEAVARLSAGDFIQAKAMMGRAFRDDPLLKCAVPDYKKRVKATPELYGGIMRYCFLYGEAYVTPELDGAACWLPPRSAPPDLPKMVRAGMLRIPLAFGWRGFHRLNEFEKNAERLHKKYASRPHWYLWALGVEPAQQGNGVGSRLLEPVLARADAYGDDCYLETQNEKNVPFYERHGFKIVWEGEVLGGAVRTCAMLRNPRG